MARPNLFGSLVDRVTVTIYSVDEEWYRQLRDLISDSREDSASYCRRVLRSHVRAHQRRKLRAAVKHIRRK